MTLGHAPDSLGETPRSLALDTESVAFSKRELKIAELCIIYIYIYIYIYIIIYIYIYIIYIRALGRCDYSCHTTWRRVITGF